jgi:hypothetical protein
MNHSAAFDSARTLPSSAFGGNTLQFWSTSKPAALVGGVSRCKSAELTSEQMHDLEQSRPGREVRAPRPSNRPKRPTKRDKKLQRLPTAGDTPVANTRRLSSFVFRTFLVYLFTMSPDHQRRSTRRGGATTVTRTSVSALQLRWAGWRTRTLSNVGDRRARCAQMSSTCRRHWCGVMTCAVESLNAKQLPLRSRRSASPERELAAEAARSRHRHADCARPPAAESRSR